MGELDLRRGWNYPAARDTVDSVQRQTIGQIYDDTNRVYRQKVRKVVRETEAIENEQTRMLVAPFVLESTTRFGYSMLEQQDESIRHVQNVVREWQDRINL
jgi:hypothetical protein